MRYAAPWDKSLRLSTGALLLVLAFAAGVVLTLASVAGGPVVEALGAFAIAVLAAIGLASWALAPTGYAVEAGTLRVERRLRPLAIPLEGVTAVGRLAELRTTGAARMGGSAGLFGHYGQFWNRGLGAFRLYATRTHDLVLLDTPGGRFVVSPEPPERFVEEVLAAAPSAARAEDVEALGQRPLPRRAKLEVAATIAALPLLAGAVLAGAAAFAPVRADVSGAAVRIERRFAPALEIPLARVLGVEVLGIDGGAGGRRFAGLEGPGISYGSFHSEALGDFRLYDSGGGPYVLLETEDGTVVLTPEDADRFVSAVRAGIATR